MHQTRTNSAAEQSCRDPSDYWAIYRRLVLFDLSEDMELGFFLAYYRNFAIPSLAVTLAGTGEIAARPRKRSYDTAIVIYEIIAGGMEDERSKTMIELLRRVHQHVPGSKLDFVYVLMTLLVVPIRWAETNGWRRPLDIEKQAAADFFADLGGRMGLSGVPRSFEEAAVLLDEYEAANAAPSSAGLELMGATVSVFQKRLPLPVRPLAKPLLSAMFDDDRLSYALGLKPASPIFSGILRGALKLRNRRLVRRPVRLEPRFQPGLSGSSLYPNGYSLAEIGPQRTPARP